VDWDYPIDWLRQHWPHLGLFDAFLAWMIKDSLEEARMKLWSWIKGLFAQEKTALEGEAIDKLSLLTPFLADELDKLKATPSLSFMALSSKDQAAMIIVKVQTILRKQAGLGG
jgi:hypothetical protein